MSTPALEVEDVTVAFGGLKALDGVSLLVNRGEVHGLIGPNGSGKTTLLNAVCGFVRVAGGHIRLNGERIDPLPTHLRVRRGLARTFQGTATFTEVDLIDNIKIGSHGHDRHSFWKACVPVLHEALEAEGSERSLKLLSRAGLDTDVSAIAGSLPYGQQRMLDFERAQAGEPSLALIDEPIAGLSQAEVQRVEKLIRTLRGLGLTVLLIEHHMRFVMNLCDRITVLNFGRAIASGTAAQVQADGGVVEAYLGTRRS